MIEVAETFTEIILMSLNIKKNNIDELFLNLTENPVGMDNKDFRLQLSTIYQLFEDEFEDAFVGKNTPLRNTNFYMLDNGDFFVTPTNNFDFYAKSKGSLFRFRSEIKEINVDGQPQEMIGYVIKQDIIFDYFTSFNEILEFEDASETFKYLNKFSHTVLKIVEKLHFIPIVKYTENLFQVKYEIYRNNKEVTLALNDIKIDVPSDFITNNEKYDFNKLLNSYLNFVIFKFLNIKATKFKDAKSAVYFVKDMSNKRYFRSLDLAMGISEWLDEIYIGKYNILPEFEILKLTDDDYQLKINVKNIHTSEKFRIEDIYAETVHFEDYTNQEIVDLIEKQLTYVARYYPELEEFFDEENQFELKMSLNEVYKIIAQISYYLQKASIDVILPEGIDNIVTPRASINAKVKASRMSELRDVISSNGTSSSALNELFEFSYTIAIGDDKLTVEEYEALTKDAQGLIRYKDHYVLIDKEENTKLIEKVKNPKITDKNKMEILHAALSSQMDDYDFDYDEAFANILKDLTKTEDVPPPESLKGVLRPYQERGFKWLHTNIKKGFGCCMADDMGLGKTIQVISFILKQKETGALKQPALVVCPTTLLGNWVKEIENFAPSVKTSIYHGIERELDTKTDVIITTYAILRIDIEKLKKQKWSMLIIDEAQNIKNPDTSQTQAVKQIKSDTKIAMTGTPVENKLTELWSIFDFINRGYLGSIRDFQKGYAIPIEKFKQSNRAEKLRLAISPFILRRLKTDKTIITDLPDKVVLNEYCYLTKTQAALYQSVLDNLMSDISKLNGINRRGMIFKLITALKQICNHPYQYLKSGDISKDISGKAEQLVSIVKQILENNEKTLIFTQYKEMGNILTTILNDELGINPLFFHGSLNRNQRDDLIKDFQDNKDSNVMILSLKAGGTGLNLTAATNVIHYDLWWNPAVEDQATDRTYRIGQSKNVMVHRFITLGTFEEKIDEMINNKKDLANVAVFEGEKIITELSDEEIYKIFSLGV